MVDNISKHIRNILDEQNSHIKNYINEKAILDFIKEYKIKTDDEFIDYILKMYGNIAFFIILYITYYSSDHSHPYIMNPFMK